MKSSDDTLGIGEVADRFGLPTHVLRHWETVGLLAPGRDPAGRRRYRPADLTRVAVVLRAKEAGLSLEAVRALTAAPANADRRQLLEQQAESLRRRIAAARASLELVECALNCDHEDITGCPHFRALVTAPEPVGRPGGR